MKPYNRIQDRYAGNETEIIKAIRDAVKAKGSPALLGHAFAWDSGKAAAEIEEASWTGWPVLAIESQAAGRTIEGEIFSAKVTGRTLYAEDRIAGTARFQALKVELEVSFNEGETREIWTGWLW